VSSLNREIIVVDDDDSVRESICALLATAGHNVEAYASPAEFLDHCDPGETACLILDQHMPQMTGLELAAKLHAEGRALPTLLVTGAATTAIIARAAALGIANVAEKPIASTDLLRLVNSLARSA
jgi:FixJ family two-component response regulator